MENIEEFEFVEDKKKKEPEEIVIYRDVDDLGRAFVTESTLRRFHIPLPMYKLLLDTKDELYEIKPKEAIYIIEHANNSFDPYTIRYQNFDFNNELDDEYQNGRKKAKQGEALEELIIYRDVDDSAKAFVGTEVLKRFHIKKPNHKVILGDVLVYEIDPVLAINIINNSNNKLAPYAIRYVNIQFDHVEKHGKEEPIPYEEKETVIPYKERVIPYEEPKKETRYPSVRRPRMRRPNETEEQYVIYLEGFYDSLFGYSEEKEEARRERKEQPKKPVIVNDTEHNHENIETDKEYVEYLKKYYQQMFRPEALEKLKPRNLIKQRKRRDDETDEEYAAYLEMFYAEPTEEEKHVRTK